MSDNTIKILCTIVLFMLPFTVGWNSSHSSLTITIQIIIVSFTLVSSILGFISLWKTGLKKFVTIMLIFAIITLLINVNYLSRIS